MTSVNRDLRALFARLKYATREIGVRLRVLVAATIPRENDIVRAAMNGVATARRVVVAIKSRDLSRIRAMVDGSAVTSRAWLSRSPVLPSLVSFTRDASLRDTRRP